MKTVCSSGQLQEQAVDTLVIFVPEFDKLISRPIKALDTASNGAVATLLESGEFTGKEGSKATIMKPVGYRCDRVVLVGLGEKKKINHDSYRRAAGRISLDPGLTNAKSAAFYLGGSEKADFYQAAIEGYLLGSYKLLDYKTGDSAENKNKLAAITFVADSRKSLRKVEKAVRRGHAIADGQCLVRTLAATPGADLTPIKYAEKAKVMARKYKISCRVLDEKAIEKERMGAYLAVAAGSEEPPRFIILEYKGGRAGQKPVVLVGKGVTFDSGGISLKAGLGMHEMKGDMAGSAVVLGALVTAARLKLPLNIVGLMPTTENMPSGHATRPGDIHTSRKGLTIENINTDAEGRLVLADALDYANTFDPQAVIDIATLTGAAVYVLGYSGAPIMGNSKKLMDRLRSAADATAERVWEMPIWDDFRDRMKSSIADLQNSGGKPAGTMTAGAFLENFIGDWPWAHIDIAYIDVEPNGRPYQPKGQTGAGMRLLVEMLSNWKKM